MLHSVRFSHQDRSCKGLRMPAMTTRRHAPTAGVGKAAMHEVAEGGARCRFGGLYGDLASHDGAVDRAGFVQLHR